LLPEITHKVLLPGMRTSLMRFAEIGKYDPSQSRVLVVKPSLAMTADGGVSLRIHPTAPYTAESYLLDPDEIERI
jgi:hypothetical protein